MFKIVRRYYEKGYYDNEDIDFFVKAGDITADQYKEITGEDYKEE